MLLPCTPLDNGEHIGGKSVMEGTVGDRPNESTECSANGATECSPNGAIR